MAKRRANGEGNLRKRKDGRWEGRYTAGHDPETGKAIYRNVLGRTQAEARAKLKQAIEEAKIVDQTKAKKYTVGEWMDVWFENYAKVKVRPSSHQTYRGYIDNHIKPDIGKIPLSKLPSLDLQKFYKKLLSSGRVERIESKKQSKGLSPKTVRNLHQIIASAMKLAKEQKLILSDPTEGCALPKVEHREMKTLPVEQLASFLREAKESGVFELYYVELATGLRRGELLALLWTDLDVENMTISVSKQVNRINGELVVSQPKTPNSIRKLAIPQRAVELLVEEHAKHPHSPHLFVSPKTGTMFDPDSFRHTHEKILKAIGAEYIRFHDLRHTFATLSLKYGVDVKTLSGALGHYDAGFTLSTYTHATAEMKRDAADAIGNVISQAM